MHTSEARRIAVLDHPGSAAQGNRTPPTPPPAWLSFPLALSLSRSPPPSPTLIRPAPPSDSGGRAARVVDCDINRGRESSAMRRAVCREAGLRFVVCLVFDNDVDMYLKFATNT